MKHLILAPGAAILLTSFAGAQSMNLDVGTNQSVLMHGAPSPLYGAGATQPGAWNQLCAGGFSGPGCISPIGWTTPAPLTDLAGNGTTATVSETTGLAWNDFPNAVLTGDDRSLLIDGGQVISSVTWSFAGLANGDYDVYSYAFDAADGSTLIEVTIGGNSAMSGGAWPGTHVEGITYTLHQVTVTDGTIDILLGDLGLGSGTICGFQLVFDGSAGLGTNYCTAAVNSTGTGAIMTASGSASIGANNLVLTSQSQPNEPYVFYTGASQIMTPFGDGFRCVGGTVIRLWPPALATGNIATRPVDLGAFGITPGLWNFQCWFRDPSGGPTGFNLSDGLELLITL